MASIKKIITEFYLHHCRGPNWPVVGSQSDEVEDRVGDGIRFAHWLCNFSRIYDIILLY